MIHLIIGGALTACLLFFLFHIRNQKLGLKWWQWLLILAEFIYIAFILEVVVSFLEEGAVKGALVLGTILGFIALAAAFLIFRLIFRPAAAKEVTE